jgi:glycosyltransferase involved in cell wall biosynthesis
MADGLNFKPTKSIIIPAYNEEARIGHVVLNLVDNFPDHEIIIVCDGQDNSINIARDLSFKYPNVQVLGFNHRLGKGGALVQGFRAVHGLEVGFIDSDESISPNDLKELFTALHDFDGAIGSRRLKESKILKMQPLKRRLASKAFNIFVRTVFGLPFSDTQCGAKAFKKSAIIDVIDEIRTTGFEIDVELLWRLRNKGYAIVEHPVTWKHSEGSKFKLSYSMGMFISLLRIRFSR